MRVSRACLAPLPRKIADMAATDQAGIDKTNALRMLDASGIPYRTHAYDSDITDGQTVARLVGKSAEETFKTLVTVGASGRHLVFMVPVNGTLSLKKAAKAAGEKSVTMLMQKELFPLTGYVHGGCSPVGMKKPFPTVIDETAVLFDTICCSAGRRGLQAELSPTALADFIHAAFADLTE